MQYVSINSSYLMQRLFIVAVCFCANTSQPAFGAEPAVSSPTAVANAERTEPEEAKDQAPADINAYLMTDEDIAQRCATAVRIHYDIVTTTGSNEERRDVPRCVLNYESMRGIAQHFRETQDHAVSLVREAKISSACAEHATQAGCVGAGSAMDRVALEAHQSMAAEAEEAEKQLQLLAGSTASSHQ